MKDKYDVLVVGGCSAGLYFAEMMAKQGYKTLVIDKDSQSDIGKRYDIFHLEKATFAKFDMPEPTEGDSEYVATFNKVISRSAKDNYPKTAANDVFVMHRSEFIKHMEKKQFLREWK